MNETFENLSEQKITDNKNHDKNEVNEYRNLKRTYFSKCFINCFSSFKNKKKNCFSTCSIINQFLIIFLPITQIISSFLITVYLYFFDNIFKFDYFTLVKEEYLQNVITDVDNVIFDLSTEYIKNHVEEIGNILFFKIYFEELISIGLLDGDNIFPNISNITQTFFDFMEPLLVIDRSNLNFSIPSNMSRKYIDERNDSLSELLKVYYNIFPIISFQGFAIQNYINQSFLIAYEMDEENNVIGEQLYFNFPRPNSNIIFCNNFNPCNDFISPKINKTKSSHSELLNNSFYNENWFTKQDYDFRESSKLWDTKLTYFHLNIHYELTLNQSFVVTLQIFFNNNKGKRYIINIIYFIGKKALILDSFDHSVFLVTNASNSLKEEKYSDNKTFVISKGNITEIALSSLVDQYFRNSIISNDYNFYYNGIFYDNINLNYLSESTKYYNSIKEFNFDLKYFSSLYLYTKLFQKSSYLTNYSNEEHINIFTFNEKWHIHDICNQFNFQIYKNYLIENKINCWNNKNLMYYNQERVNNSIMDGVSIPFCICLPLYCIQNNNKDFDPNKIEYVEKVTLPEKCQNNLMYYKNGIIKKNADEADLFDTENEELKFGQPLIQQIEVEYIKFSYQKYKAAEDLNFIIFSIANNKASKIILTQFVKNLNQLRKSFIVSVTTLILFLELFIDIIIIINLCKISNIIYEYKKILSIFLDNFKNKKDNNENIDNEFSYKEKTGFIIDTSNNFDNFPLIKKDFLEKKVNNKLRYSLNDEDNFLIDNIFKIYCKYYKISEEKMLINFKENQIKTKAKTLYENNELFKLLYLISLNLSKFNLNINIDYDFYKDSKLMKNFIKCLSRKSLIEYKEQYLYTKSIIYELLSSELIGDYGLVTNLDFNYYTNINVNSKKKDSAIQKGIFRQMFDLEIKNKKLNFLNENKNNENSEINLVWKNKNLIMKAIETKFEQDDYIQLDKLDSAFNNYLKNGFYNYIKKVLKV